MAATKVYKSPKCKYKMEGNHIRAINPTPAKLSGTALAGVLNCSPWSSPFQVACNLLGLCKEDISSKPAVKVGTALEPVIIEYADKNYSHAGQFLYANEVYAKREGDHDSWVSDFKDDHFAGHVDGIVLDGNGEPLILEVKTSGNMDAWKEGVPEYYYWQVALYNHFITKRDKAYVLLGKVDSNTYKDPNSWVPNKNTVQIYDLSIDMAAAEEKINEAREWYKTYILNGVTPDYDPNNEGDVEMYHHLLNLTDTVETVQALVDQLAQVQEDIAYHESEKADLYIAQDELRTRIKEYMDVHKLTSLDSMSGKMRAVITIQNRRNIDEGKIKEAGLNPDNYKTERIVKSFTLKENEIVKESE